MYMTVLGVLETTVIVYQTPTRCFENNMTLPHTLSLESTKNYSLSVQKNKLFFVPVPRVILSGTLSSPAEGMTVIELVLAQASQQTQVIHR